MKRPTEGARREGRKLAGATVYPFPASARQHRTPVEIRLDALRVIACELRRLQHEEQLAGVFTTRLSLALDNFDLIEERLKRNYEGLKFFSPRGGEFEVINGSQKGSRGVTPGKT